MGITDFFKRHTTHTTPLFVAGVIFVGVPVLTSLDASMETLAKLPTITAMDWNRAFVKAGVVGLSSLGGFMSTTFKEWQDDRKKKRGDGTTPPVRLDKLGVLLLWLLLFLIARAW